LGKVLEEVPHAVPEKVFVKDHVSGNSKTGLWGGSEGRLQGKFFLRGSREGSG